MRWMCNIFCGAAALLLVVLGLIAFDTSPVLTFGLPEQSYLKVITDDTVGPPTELPSFAPGDKMKICFDAIVWYRIIPSKGKMFFYDANGKRVDFSDEVKVSIHKVSLPSKTGPLGPKCRIETMPAGLPIGAGPSVLTGTLISTDTFLGITRVVTGDYPKMKFTVKGP